MTARFISFEQIENEKCVGIATVAVADKVVLKYKVFPGKNGNGYFICAPSVKVGEVYSPAFKFDSSSLNEEIENLIRKNIPKPKAITNLPPQNTAVYGQEELPF